jgi:hypothetical protein
MARNNTLRSVVAKQGAKTAEFGDLSLKDASLLGVKHERKDGERPYVNLKYYRPDYQCLSIWTKAKLQAFSGFCRQLTQMNWAEIYATGGKAGNKVGLGYTVHKDHAILPENPELNEISADLTWFELRVDGKSRVHGFRVKDAFFLVYLDQEHGFYPG